MLQEQIQKDMQNAMREKDERKLLTLRAIMAAITNKLVEQRRKPNEVLEDDTVLQVISSQAKQRKDSILQFEKGGRKDLIEEEKKELSVLEGYLPEGPSKDKITEIVQSKKNELGINDKSKMGQLIGAVIKETEGQADGNIVKEIVEKCFD